MPIPKYAATAILMEASSPTGQGVCDRDNRMYIILRTPQGGIAITPYPDRGGSQRVMPRP